MPRNPPSGSKRGRASRWSDEQDAILDAALPEWHNFSLIGQHRNLKGDDLIFLRWKKKKTEEIMSNSVFENLPEGMSRADARLTVVRKFTNYRGVHIRKGDNLGHKDSKQTDPSHELNPEIRALELSGSSTADSEPKVLALKLLMSQAQESDGEIKCDQRCQNKGALVPNDTFENQKQFIERAHQDLEVVCRSQEFGPMEMRLFFAYRTEDGNIEAGCIQAHHNKGVPHYLMGAVLDKEMKDFGTYASGVLPEIESTQPATHLPSHDFQSSGMGQSPIETSPIHPEMGPSHEIASSLSVVLADESIGLSPISPSRDDSTKREQSFPFQQASQSPSVAQRSMNLSFLLSPVDYD